ncbi:reverse transcriptase domain-containing protein, partial [Tanacetum coccineum]
MLVSYQRSSSSTFLKSSSTLVLLPALVLLPPSGLDYPYVLDPHPQYVLLLGMAVVVIHSMAQQLQAESLKALIEQGVADALVARDADRSMNGDDSHNSGMGVRRTERVARECTYQDFMKCQPLFFKGTEGVVELTQWFKRMETVFRISNYSVENQIKFATCTLLGIALMWWNSHVRTVSHDMAYAMTWTTLKKKMTDKYCPRGKIKKLEAELWNQKVKGTDVLGYNQRFQELALLCVRMFPEESDKIERYVSGLPDMVHGSVVES